MVLCKKSLEILSMVDSMVDSMVNMPCSRGHARVAANLPRQLFRMKRLECRAAMSTSVLHPWCCRTLPAWLSRATTSTEHRHDLRRCCRSSPMAVKGRLLWTYLLFVGRCWILPMAVKCGLAARREDLAGLRAQTMRWKPSGRAGAAKSRRKN